MNEVLRFLNMESGQGSVLGLWEVLIALGLTYACSLIIGMVYRYTHRSPSYSQGYVHSLVLTSMVTALIMLVIGSNLARAFSLVGALSIIRFRNAVKETRDVGYIFFRDGGGHGCRHPVLHRGPDGHGAYLRRYAAASLRGLWSQ